MAKDEYLWWRKRLQALLKCVDIIRLDHFRGFEAFWEIPGNAKTAESGRWVKGPGAEFFSVVEKYFGSLPIIVEDLDLLRPRWMIYDMSFIYQELKYYSFPLSTVKIDDPRFLAVKKIVHYILVPMTMILRKGGMINSC